MRIRHLLSATLVTGLLTTQVQAAPSREVIIDQERFDRLTCEEQAHVLEIRSRLEGIMATDRSQLDAAGRKALRSDWRALKEEMAAVNRDGTTIYISTAGIIIIILLLIILL